MEVLTYLRSDTVTAHGGLPPSRPLFAAGQATCPLGFFRFAVPLVQSRLIEISLRPHVGRSVHGWSGCLSSSLQRVFFRLAAGPFSRGHKNPQVALQCHSLSARSLITPLMVSFAQPILPSRPCPPMSLSTYQLFFRSDRATLIYGKYLPTTEKG